MEIVVEATKTKTLAVFENVVTKARQKKRKTFKTHRFSDEESSPSESELVIDDEVKEESTKRKKTGDGARVRSKEEKLTLTCEWESCTKCFDSVEQLFNHVGNHTEFCIDLTCQWRECPNPSNIPSMQLLLRHLSYHCYLAKLINIGQNVVERNKLPECYLERKYQIFTTEYMCEWRNCDNLFINNIHDFLAHVECHVLGYPTGKKAHGTEVITCDWAGCGSEFSNRYKLADHMKVHTKERTIACPKCFALFFSNTTFSNHRKRQLKTDLRSYQCSQCLKLFSIEKLLSDHMRSHINQYKCTLCDMTSTTPSMLAKHYRYRHMNVRSFSCHICKKTFVAKCNLNAHLLSHQEKPFKCDQCEFGCKSKAGIKSHMVKVHGLESSIYECQVCKQQYKRGDYLTYHLFNEHKFHWPSGHCRFRYRKDSDGIHRLQTVRYESLEVTEQMLKSESMQLAKNAQAMTYILKQNDGNEYVLTEKVECEESTIHKPDPGEDCSDDVQCTETRPIIIIIEDLDEKGNIISSKEIDTTLCINVEDKSGPGNNKDMPLFENFSCGE